MTTKTTRRTRTPENRRAAPEVRPRRVVAVRVLDEVFRVEGATGTIGYVELVGTVYVTLRGAVYNTSVEIAQCHDLETAVERLRTAT